MAYSELANPRATRAVLDRFGLGAKHALGQNFLVDDNIIGRILETCGLLGTESAKSTDLTSVVEIGPGIGTLTVALLEHAHVVSVERDRDLVPVLAETTALHSERFSLVEGDALKTTQAQIESAFERIGAPLGHMLVANLPYAVAATVILDWFERFDFLDSMTVMVQSEVADRICAERGVKDYGAYTIKLRMFAQVADRFQVAPSCFYPAPRVHSAVIRLDRVASQHSRHVVRAACELADAAFAQRRKNIRNSMRSAFDVQTVDALLDACGIEPTVRGETLACSDYLAMGEALCRMNAS